MDDGMREAAVRCGAVRWPLTTADLPEGYVSPDRSRTRRSDQDNK